MKKIILSLLFILSVVTSGFSQIFEDFEGTEVPTAFTATANPNYTQATWSLTTSAASGDWKIMQNQFGPAQSWKQNTSTTFTYGGAGRSADVQREFVGQGNTSEDWLIMPRKVMRANEQLRFFTRQGINGDSGTLYQIRVSTNIDPTIASAYTVFRTFTEQELSQVNGVDVPIDQWNEKVVNMTQTGQNLFIAFVKVHTQTGTGVSGDRWLLDNVQLALRCLEPTAQNAVNITCNSATLTWGNPAGASSFTYEYGLYPFAFGTGTPVTTTSGAASNPLNTISGLTGGTRYAYYVYATCSPGITSDPVGPYFFDTLQTGALCACPISFSTLPYSNTNNTSVFGDHITSPTPGATNCGTGGNYLGAQDAVYEYIPATTGNVTITMNPQGSANTGVFVYANCAAIGNACTYGVGNTTANVRTIPLVNVTAGVPIYIVVSSLPSTFSFDYTLTVQVASCPTPVTLGGTATNNSANLTWLNPAGSTYTNFEYAVQLAGDQPPATGVAFAGLPNTTTNILTATTLVDGTTPLVAGTNYQYWVRADCGDGTFSAWAGPYLFTTALCGGSDICNYVFVLNDTANDGWEGGRMQVSQNGVIVATIGATITGGTATVNVPLCTGLPFQLFWSVPGTSPAEIGVIIRNSFNQTLYTMTSGNQTQAGTILYSGIVDCVNPLCFPPTGALTSNTITTSSANLTWNQVVLPAGNVYNVYVAPAPFTAPSATNPVPPVTAAGAFLFTGVSPGFTATGLAQDTQYRFWVQSACSANGPSDWTTTSGVFTTLPMCSRVTALNVGTMSISTVTGLADVPMYWTTPGAPANPTNSWYVIAVPLTVPATPTPTFDIATWLPVAAQPTAVAPFIYPGLQPDTAYNYYVVSDCGVVNGVSNVAGPRGFTTPQACIKPTNPLVVTPTTTTTSIGMYWTYPNTNYPQNWRVIVKPTYFVGTPLNTDPDWVVVNLPAGSAPPTAGAAYYYGTHPGETPLTPNTTYKYFVQAVCDSPYGNSSAVGPRAFNTIKTCFPPRNLFASGITSRNAKLIWQQGVSNGLTSTETSWYVIAVPATDPVPVYPISTSGTGWIHVTTLPTAGNEFTFTGGPVTGVYPDGPLMPDTNYTFYVVADCGESSFIHATISNPVVTEGTSATFTISLSSISAVDTTINIATPIGTAGATDFTAVAPLTTVTILAGQLSTTVVVPTLVDALVEQPETFTLVGSITSGNVVNPAIVGTATINDATGTGGNPYITIDNVTVLEGQTAVFTVSLSSASATEVTANVNLVNGTTVVADYTAPATLPVALTFAPGVLTQTISIPITYDSVSELTEFFSLVATVSSSNTANPTTTGYCNIYDSVIGTPRPFKTLPSCLQPAALNIVSGSQTTTTVNLWWTNSTGSFPTVWQIVAVPSGQPASSGTIIETFTGAAPPVAGTPYTFGLVSPLTPDTDYDFYVRADCGTLDGVSQWTGPKTVRTDPTCLQPTTLGWVNTNNNPAVLTWVQPGSVPQSFEVFIQPTPGTAPTAGSLGVIVPGTQLSYTIPAGFTPGFYEFYVRAICSDSDKSRWSGPVNFNVYAESVACAAINLNLEGGASSAVVCDNSPCVTLNANYTDLFDTTSYKVVPVIYNPPFASNLGTDLNIGTDDLWSPQQTLPFPFCFYGNSTQNAWVGSNGVITFTNPGGTFCNWSFNQTIPNAAFPIRNAVYGVYQDIDPSIATGQPKFIKYGTVGTAPCRAFVVNFYQIAQFGSGNTAGLQTSQIVLWETSNIVEVYVQRRVPNTNWQNGVGVIGIQNGAGTDAYTPPGRNTGAWTAINEAYRFEPNGASIVNFQWKQGTTTISNTTSANVCPTANTTYTAVATYSQCGGAPISVSTDVPVVFYDGVVADPIPVVNCGPYTLPVLAQGQYFTEVGGPTGTGVELLAGTVISATTIIHVYTSSNASVLNPACSGDKPLSITINEVPALPVSGGDITECTQSPVQMLTATATAPTGATVMWYTDSAGTISAQTTTLNTVGTVTYYAESVDDVSGCKSLLTPVTLTIVDSPTAPISGGDQSECEQDPIQTLTATATPAVGTDLVWFDMAAGGLVVPNPILNTVGTITYYAESVVPGAGGCVSLTRTPVTLEIKAAPDAPVSGGDITECTQSPVQTLTATATTPTGVSVVWYSDSAGTTVVTSTTLNAVGTVTYYAESVDDVSGCKSLTRTPVTLTIIDAPAAPVSGGDQSECAQDPIQTLTAMATPAVGTDLVWYAGTSGGTPITDVTLSTIGSVTYYAESVVTGPGGCVSLTRTPVTLEIKATPDAPVSGGDITECTQSPVQMLTATATAPTGASVVWYSDSAGTIVATSTTLNAVGTVTYYAESVDDTNGCKSLILTPVTLTIVDAPDAPVSGGDQSECAQDPIQTLTAMATPAVGTDLVWYAGTSGGTPITDVTLSTIGSVTYYAESVVTGPGGCVSLTRTPVTLEIKATPDAPVSGGDITECTQSPVQMLTATATAPTGASVVWYSDSAGTIVASSTTLNAVGTVTYYAESVDDTNGCKSLTLTPVTLTIVNAPDAPVSGGDQSECAQDPIQTLTATATPAVGTDLVWYDMPALGNIVAATDVILNTVGTITYYAESVITGPNGCRSLTRTPVTLEIKAIPAAPTDTTTLFDVCAATPMPMLTATATADTGLNVVWFDDLGNPVLNPTWNQLGSVTYYAESQNPTTTCVSNTRTAVTLTIRNLPAAPVEVVQAAVCATTPIQTLTPNATAPTDADVEWFATATGGTAIVPTPTWSQEGSMTYYAESVYTVAGCRSATRTPVTLTINPLPAAPTATSVSISECSMTPVQTLTATATAPTGSNVVWYSAATGGNVVTNPTLSMVGNATYYAESVDATTGCVSSSRTQVYLEITIVPKFEIEGNCVGSSYVLAVVPPGENILSSSTYSWKNSLGQVVATTPTYIAPSAGNYSLTITTNSCPITVSQLFNTISCSIQKGISPKGVSDGDGLNDYFDLQGLNVSKLEVFNRYGKVVYSKANYTKEWYGQTDSGDALPDATYFYVIDRNDGEPITGWIYINREQ